MSAARRVDAVANHLHAAASVNAVDAAAYASDLRAMKMDIERFLDESNANPIMVRLAWHDAGTYDASKAHMPWPRAQGANGSIRHESELAHGANAGLVKAIGYLRPLKEKYARVSWADAIQLAGATAIEHAGGPRIPMRYGRADAEVGAMEGNLPDAEAPFGDGASDAATHLRNVFGRMGFNDREIVALSGAHTIGRAFKERSGTTNHGYGAKNGTKFTGCPYMNARADGKEGSIGMPGGASWTRRWLAFDNSYFHREKLTDEKDLIWLSTDDALVTDPGFAPHFKRYAHDQNAFFYDFSAAFAKLSELGSRFVVGASGITSKSLTCRRCALNALLRQSFFANSLFPNSQLKDEFPDPSVRVVLHEFCASLFSLLGNLFTVLFLRVRTRLLRQDAVESDLSSLLQALTLLGRLDVLIFGIQTQACLFERDDFPFDATVGFIRHRKVIDCGKRGVAVSLKHPLHLLNSRIHAVPLSGELRHDRIDGIRATFLRRVLLVIREVHLSVLGAATDGAGKGEAPSGRMKRARGFSRGLKSHPPLDGVATETELPGLTAEVGVLTAFTALVGVKAETLPRGFGSLLKPPRLVSHGDRGVRDRTGNAVAAAPADGLCIVPRSDLFAGSCSVSRTASSPQLADRREKRERLRSVAWHLNRRQKYYPQLRVQKRRTGHHLPRERRRQKVRHLSTERSHQIDYRPPRARKRQKVLQQAQRRSKVQIRTTRRSLASVHRTNHHQMWVRRRQTSRRPSPSSERRRRVHQTEQKPRWKHRRDRQRPQKIDQTRARRINHPRPWTASQWIQTDHRPQRERRQIQEWSPPS
ncbi:chloroplast ascorbate peroxidase [Ostreococcus tauri]|uniref:Chloroplast ascorbate peroxidase n=1 Tax=Ostreococcus tauri TaxID=70448 RepID=A0A1Y5HZ97_OSTTA|nr:chloroplast ascorbate peroxidase [Ostreococcus tauri]